MEMDLDLLQPGRSATVVCIRSEKALKARLQDFGLVPGTVVHCRFRSPDGCVTALEFRGLLLALRTTDLKHIRVRCQ